MNKVKFRRGDKVKVLLGKDKGKIGEVTQVLPKAGRVVILGINVARRHTKPTKMSEGGILPKELSIHISNIAHIDSASDSHTKVSCGIDRNNKKVILAKKSGQMINRKELCNVT